jgi:hypothetical protein
MKLGILIQGHVYLTENHLCFYSKFNDKTLFGKSTRLKIPYTQFTLLKKENGALMLPNSIKIGEIQTSADGTEQEVFHVLTSFIWRDDCFSLI